MQKEKYEKFKKIFLADLEKYEFKGWFDINNKPVKANIEKILDFIFEYLSKRDLDIFIENLKKFQSTRNKVDDWHSLKEELHSFYSIANNLSNNYKIKFLKATSDPTPDFCLYNNNEKFFIEEKTIIPKKSNCEIPKNAKKGKERQKKLIKDIISKLKKKKKQIKKTNLILLNIYCCSDLEPCDIFKKIKIKLEDEKNIEIVNLLKDKFIVIFTGTGRGTNNLFYMKNNEWKENKFEDFLKNGLKL